MTMAVGCKREAAPPTPISAEAIPAELDKATATAKPAVKELAQQIKAALQKKDYPLAHQAVQALSYSSDATEAQRALANRALLTVTELLQTAAQTQGDQNAAEAIRVYKATK